MLNENEYLSDSTYFEIDLSFLSQNIENLQKHAELFRRERRAATRGQCPAGCRNPTRLLKNGSCSHIVPFVLIVCFAVRLWRDVGRKWLDLT
jgi:hypothetical protein